MCLDSTPFNHQKNQNHQLSINPNNPEYKHGELWPLNYHLASVESGSERAGSSQRYQFHKGSLSKSIEKVRSIENLKLYHNDLRAN